MKGSGVRNPAETCSGSRHTGFPRLPQGTRCSLTVLTRSSDSGMVVLKTFRITCQFSAQEKCSNRLMFKIT